VLGGVGGRLHLTVPSMNRLNQTKPATILPCWAFFMGSYFLYFIKLYINARLHNEPRYPNFIQTERIAYVMLLLNINHWYNKKRLHKKCKKIYCHHKWHGPCDSQHYKTQSMSLPKMINISLNICQ
jgi:hypothetical protein